MITVYNMRGQSSQEFLFILPLVFTVFAAFVLIFFYQSTLLAQTRERLQARNFAHELVGISDSVYIAGEGATYNLSRGPYWEDYTATAYPGIIEIISESSTLTQFPLLFLANNKAQLNTSISITHKGASLEYSE